MRYSRWNTLACALVITASAALYVIMSDIGAASVDATRVLMKEMGFNLEIIAGAADMARYQALDFEGPDMPEEYVDRLAGSKTIMAQHFVGKLQHALSIEGYTAILTGVLGQTIRTGTTKDPMPTSYIVPRGKVFLGAATATSMNKKVGDRIAILGREFDVERVLERYGAIPEDIRLFAHLKDVQELLGRPGRINAIAALACQCPANVKDIIAMVGRSIQQILPDVQVQPYYSILLARHEQRVLMRRLQLAVLAGTLAAAAAALWGLTYQNVSGRHHEIGVLRALGFSDAKILFLFLGKTLLYALPAAVFGIVLGRAGYFLFHEAVSMSVLTPISSLCLLIPITVLAAMLFSMPPVMGKLLQDPADILGETLQ